jgi:hypothetical protein
VLLVLFWMHIHMCMCGGNPWCKWLVTCLRICLTQCHCSAADALVIIDSDQQWQHIDGKALREQCEVLKVPMLGNLTTRPITVCIPASFDGLKFST